MMAMSERSPPICLCITDFSVASQHTREGAMDTVLIVSFVS
jgi:hypothetical protein